MSSQFQPPRLLYRTEVRRSSYWQRLPRLALGTAAAAGAYWAIAAAQRRGVVDMPLLVDIGKLIAAFLAGYLAVQFGLCLYRALTRRNERIMVFDKGFTWQRGGQKYQYKWSQVQSLREGASGFPAGKQPLLQWGAHRLRMVDGNQFRFTAAQGDPRKFAAAVRRPIATVTSIRMGQRLREEEPIRLHPKLTIWPGGVEAYKREIPWSNVNIGTSLSTLRIQQLNTQGKFKTVARYRIGSIENLGGFLELAHTTIRNHQPERFRRAREAAADAMAMNTER